MWLTDTDIARKLMANVLEVKIVRCIKCGEWLKAARLSKKNEKTRSVRENVFKAFDDT